MISAYSLKHIIQFLGEEFNLERIGEDTDLYGDLNINGDDFFEMIADYAHRFKVDMKEYLWYFHSGEQSVSVGGFFFPSPDKRVKRIPITPRMLVEFANKGKWEIFYPAHQIPSKRWDIIINRILAIFTLIAICVYVLMKLG